MHVYGVWACFHTLLSPCYHPVSSPPPTTTTQKFFMKPWWLLCIIIWKWLPTPLIPVAVDIGITHVMKFTRLSFFWDWNRHILCEVLGQSNIVTWLMGHFRESLSFYIYSYKCAGSLLVPVTILLDFGSTLYSAPRLTWIKIKQTFNGALFVAHGTSRV